MTWLSLADLAAAGYVVDEWWRWQQGGCGTYALALLQSHPGLRLGVALDDRGAETHFFAHDSVYAYDSAGRHRLPYLGVQPTDQFDQVLLDQNPDDWDLDEVPSDIPDAAAHQRRHRITPLKREVNA